MRHQFFADQIDDDKYLGYLFGLGAHVAMIRESAPVVDLELQEA
jgi:hypothetical protein